MEHPLIGDTSDLTLEQVQGKINELTKKLTIAYRLGNGMLVSQVQMALETYQNRYRTILDKMYAAKGQDLQGKIDIS